MPGIDLHTHLAPRIDPADVALEGLSTGDDGRLRVHGKPVGPPHLYRPDLLETYRAELGLDEVVVSVPPPFFRQELPAAEAAVWVPALNAGLADAVADQPHASALAYLPLEHPELALAEYERIGGVGAWVGVVASAGGASVSLADPALRPLWSALDRDGRMLLLHPGSSPDARLDPYYLSNLLGNPAETTLAAAQLVFGDVLAAYPRMRVLLVHCGGCVPSLVGRWERGVATNRPGLEPLTESPRVAVRRMYVDCLAHDPAVLDLAATTFGDDRIVLGSDWPFPMGIDDPRTLVAHRGPAFVAAVETANARAALGRDA